MSFDKFKLFCLSVRQQEMVAKYVSPSNEESVFKGIPLTELEEMKFVAKHLTGSRVRVMYRGPRKNGSYSTRRCWAHSASIYIKCIPWKVVTV